MSMRLKRWIVTVVDFDQHDSKACILATCKTRAEAMNFIVEDMREYVDVNSNEDTQLILNDQELKVTDLLGCAYCEWNIEEVEFELTEYEVFNIGAKCHNIGIQNGVDSLCK